MTSTSSVTRSGEPELQPDDLEILRLLNQDFLLLTGKQICKFFPKRSQRAIDGRLQKLSDSGYLSLRYPGKLFLSQNRPSYYLAIKAIRMLRTDPSDKRPLLRSQRSRDFGDTAFLHLLFTNAIQIKFQTAGHEYPDYKFEAWIQQYDPVWAKLSRDGFQLRPDGLAKAWKGDRRFLCFIEADRGTYRGKHLENRLARYARHASKHPHPAAFEFKNPRFRVLFIAESPNRAKRLLKAFAPYHSDLFWVTSWDQFSKEPLFHPHWRTSESTTLRALDEPYELPLELPEPPPPPEA
jgi:hypothetical protein